MAGVAVEDALELWASSLREVKRRIRPLFSQERVAVSAGLFLDGLLGPERRKTGWMRAEAAGDPGPWRQQAILGRGRWEADALRDLVRDYAVESLADQDAVLVLDGTGFLKQGKVVLRRGAPVHGLGRQDHQLPDRGLRGLRVPARPRLHRPGTISAQGLDRRSGPPGRRPCPARDRLRDQAPSCVAMIERAIAAEVPFAWVAADSVYGVGGIETALRQAGKGYVLGVNGSHPFNSWGDKPPVTGTAEEIAQALPASAWARLSAGEGTKGPRLHDWAYLELADLEAAEYDDSRSGLWTRGLLVRRSIADGELAFFTTWCPAGTGIETLVKVEGHRWAIEDGFETAKNELGLDHNETRSWHGWHRHVSLVMLAFAMLAVIRHHANAPTPPKIPIRLARRYQTSSAGRSRSSAASPSASPSDASSPPMSSPGRSGDAPTRPPHDVHT